MDQEYYERTISRLEAEVAALEQELREVYRENSMLEAQLQDNYMEY